MLFPVLALMDHFPLGKQRTLNTSSCLCAPHLARGPLLGRVGQPHGETAGGSGRVLASTPAGVPFGELSTPLASAGEVEVSDAMRS